MIRIDLLRHGEVVGGPRFRGRIDDPVTKTGWQQMQETLARHGGCGWSAVWSSPLRRCADFARSFADQRGLPMTLDERFQEIDFGRWEGLTAADIMQHDAEALAAFWQNPEDNPPPGGETLTDFAARIDRGWQAACAQAAPGSAVLIITHGGVIRLLLARHGGQAASPLAAIAVPPASLHSIETQHTDHEPAGS